MPEFCKYHIYGLIMQSLNPAWIHDFGCAVSLLGTQNLDVFFKWRNAEVTKMALCTETQIITN